MDMGVMHICYKFCDMTHHVVCFHAYSIVLLCSSAGNPVTVSTDKDVTELNITGLIPFTNYTLYWEAVTVLENSTKVFVKTLEDGAEC